MWDTLRLHRLAWGVRNSEQLPQARARQVDCIQELKNLGRLFASPKSPIR